MQIKRRALVPTLVILSLLATIPVFSQEAVRVYFNGNPLVTSAPPFVENGYTYVPARDLFSVYGFQTQWDSQNAVATGHKGAFEIELKPNAMTAKINGSEQDLDSPVLLRNDRIFVPIRFVTQAIGADVAWDQSANRVDLSWGKLDDPLNLSDFHLDTGLKAITGKGSAEQLQVSDVYYLLDVDLSHAGISTLDGIECLENVQRLDLSSNAIQDLSPLKALQGTLRSLTVSDNRIDSLEALNGFDALETLLVNDNDLTDINAVQYLPKLKVLHLANNRLDTAEELSPLYYLSNRLTLDITVTSIEEPTWNTEFLRADAHPYRVLVSPGVYWVPASTLGVPNYSNDSLHQIIQNTPSGKASKVRTLYDLLQYLQHTSLQMSGTDAIATDIGAKTAWTYPSPASTVLNSPVASEAALAHAAAYLLHGDYADSGVLGVVLKDGTIKYFTYIRTLESFYVEDPNSTKSDEDLKEIFKQTSSYYVFNPSAYLKNVQLRPAIEDGRIESYNASSGALSNIHQCTDLLAFAAAVSGKEGAAAAFTVSNPGRASETLPLGSYIGTRGAGGQYIILPAATDSDDIAWQRCSILFDNPNDQIYLRWLENQTKQPSPAVKP